MKRYDGRQTKPSNEDSEEVKKWMKVFHQTYQKNRPLSDGQIEAYEIALKGLEPKIIERGFRRALCTWTSTEMPPPGFLYECAKAESEREFLEKKKKRFDSDWEPIKRFETVEAAWDDWIETEKVMRECREKLAEVVKLKSIPRFYGSKMVVATKERMQLLEKQKIQLEETYGQGTAIRVRDSVPRETDQSGTRRQSGTENRASDGPETNRGQVKG